MKIIDKYPKEVKNLLKEYPIPKGFRLAAPRFSKAKIELSAQNASTQIFRFISVFIKPNLYKSHEN